jgi:co-chaperonin GroES (HSP10)
MNITQDIKPNRGYVLGEVVSEERKTDSGLYIATTLKKGIPPKRVRVISIGKPTLVKRENGKIKEIDGKEATRWKIAYDSKGNPKEKAWGFEEGDTIFIKPHTGIRIQINGRLCMFLKRGDILGVEEGS